MIYSLRFKKDVLILEILPWIFYFLFSLKLYPIQVLISFPLGIKLTTGQLLLLFLCNFSSLFSYAGGVLVSGEKRFSLLFVNRFLLFSKLNSRGAFAIIFLICSHLLNCLRSVGIIVITTESG